MEEKHVANLPIWIVIVSQMADLAAALEESEKVAVAHLQVEQVEVAVLEDLVVKTMAHATSVSRERRRRRCCCRHRRPGRSRHS